MSRWVKVSISLAVALVVVLAGTAAVGYWTVRRSFPQTSGTIEVPGLDAPVRVTRDDHGIPQVYAETSRDLFFAQGYVQAQDRFFEMDFRRHLTAGRLAELFGDDAHADQCEPPAGTGQKRTFNASVKWRASVRPT